MNCNFEYGLRGTREFFNSHMLRESLQMSVIVPHLSSIFTNVKSQCFLKIETEDNLYIVHGYHSLIQ